MVTLTSSPTRLHTHRLTQLYREAAPTYHASIAPVMAALATRAFTSVSFRPGDRVLDIGAGTGAAINALFAIPPAQRLGIAVGIDRSYPMLTFADRRGAPQRAFVCTDAHSLPFPDAAFDVALAAFCFNETEPRAAFGEAYRVLRPGGQLVFVEWGPVEPLMSLVDDLLAEYATDTAQTPAQAQMRALAARVRPWDEAVCSGRDVATLLGQAGFACINCAARRARVPFANPDAFIDYALAWPTRRVEIDAMPAPVRARFYVKLRARLGTGVLIWQPPLLRATATRIS